MTAKHVFRWARWLLVVVIKFLFVFWLVAVEPIVDLIRYCAKLALDWLRQWLWFRIVIEHLARLVERFDDWLRGLSIQLVFTILGVLAVIGLGLGVYKVWLLAHEQIELLFYVEIGEKCSFALIFKHLLHVYHDRLLVYPKLRLVYEKAVVIRAEVIAWIAANRYSKLALAWRAAHRHECCLTPWFA